MKLTDTDTLRAKLDTWLSRMTNAGYPEFHYILKQFYTFLRTNPVLVSLCSKLERRKPSGNYTNWDQLVRPLFLRNFTDEKPFFDNEADHYAFCYQIVTNCALEKEVYDAKDKLTIEMEFARRYHPTPPMAHMDWLYTFFVRYIIRPLLIYLEEALDSNKMILAILQRYKHKCEWFQRSTLHNLWTSERSKGEKVLKMHLFEYLFDSGLQFSIEPHSPLGEADLVSHALILKQGDSDSLTADAKLIKDGTGRTEIIEGFHQVYKYTLDYDDPFGYLIIFNACDRDINVAGDGADQRTQYVEHGGRSVYVIVIDICPSPVSASERGKLNAVVVTKNELISTIPSAAESNV